MSSSNLLPFLLVILLESLLGIATVRCQCITTLQLDASTSKVEPLDYPVGDQVTYQKNSNCKWLISAPQSYCIRFNFTMLSTESSYSSPDTVAVYDGQTKNDREIVKLSGDSHPVHYFYTLGSTALVNFLSDSDTYVGDGFTLNYQAVPCECHSNPPQNVPASMDAVGKIDYISGTDQNYNYPQSANCYWLITAPESKCIRFNFSYLSTESSYSSSDTVAVYDGPTISNKRITQVLGSTFPTGNFFTSGPSALINFHSDSDDYVGDGFTLQYQAVPNSYCGKKEVCIVS
jgi:hypothetical protein